MKPVNDNTYIAGKKHVDGKRLRADGTPWTSTSEVLLTVALGDRVESQEFYIVDKLWWLKGGVADVNLIEKLEGGTSELISKFTSNPIPTIVGTDILVPADEKWLIDSVPYTNPLIATIPFTYAPSSLLYFLTVVATKFNTFIGKVGTASADPSEPVVNNDELFLTTYLISDGSVDIIVPPVTSNIYVEKESYYPFIYNSGVAVIGSIGMDKRCNLVLGGSITKIGNVIKNNPNHFVLGQYFLTTNKTGGDIEVEHLNTVGGSDVISYFNPEETSYILKNNEVAVWVSELLGGQKIHRRATTYIDRDNLVYRSGTKVGKPIFGDLVVKKNIGLSSEEKLGIYSRIYTQEGKWFIQIINGLDNPTFEFNPDKGLISNTLFDKASDPKAFIQLGDIAQLESDVFDLGIENTGDETTASIQTKRPLKTVNGNSLEGSGNIVISGGGGGAVDSVNGQTGVVVLNTSNVSETTDKNYVTDAEKLAITHSNRAILDLITEAFTTGLKTVYDNTTSVLSTLLATGSRLITTGEITKLSNTSGVNTGDQDLSGKQDVLGFTPENVANKKTTLTNNDTDYPTSKVVTTALGLKQDTLTDTNFGTFTNSVANKNTQADTDVLAYVDVTTGKWVKQTFSKTVDYFKGFFVTKKAIVTNASVSGTFNIDASLTDTYNLTLTGNTTLALINTSSTYAEPMTVYITGSFTLAYPAGATLIGEYLGNRKNQLVIEKIGSVIFITVNNYV